MRELSLIGIYFKNNFKQLQIYEIDFYLGIIGFVIENLLNILMMFFMYTLVDKISGFSFNEMLLLYGTASLSFSVWRCFFINTLNIGSMIRRGTMDAFLLRPLNVLFQIMMSGFDDDAWGDLFFSILLIIYAGYRQDLNLIWIVLLLLLCFSTSFIFAGLSILGSIFSFFTGGMTDFSGIVYNVFQFSKYPIGIFGNFTKFIFTFCIPVAWVAAIPVQYIVQHQNINALSSLAMAALISVVFFIFSAKLWNKILKTYVSTGF